MSGRRGRASGRDGEGAVHRVGRRDTDLVKNTSISFGNLVPIITSRVGCVILMLEKDVGTFCLSAREEVNKVTSRKRHKRFAEILTM